jgi:hypothetical protein
MELILHLDKFLSQQLAFIYSLLNHRMEPRTAVVRQVLGIEVAARTAGMPYAESVEGLGGSATDTVLL